MTARMGVPGIDHSRGITNEPDQNVGLRIGVKLFAEKCPANSFVESFLPRHVPSVDSDQLALIHSDALLEISWPGKSETRKQRKRRILSCACPLTFLPSNLSFVVAIANLIRMVSNSNSSSLERCRSSVAPPGACIGLFWKQTVKRAMVMLFVALSAYGYVTAARGDELIPARPEQRDSARIKVERADQRLIVRAQLPGTSEWVELATCVTETNARPYLHPVRDATGRV